MFKKITSLMLIYTFLILLCGCNQNDTDELSKKLQEQEKQLSELNQRLNNLEDLMKTANSEIKTINDLIKVMEDKITITSYKELDDKSGYELIMSDNSKIVLQNGKTPVIGVKRYTDKLLYWTLNNNWMLDAKGEMIRAQGLDGLTPIMRVNDQGQWEMSVDEGVNWRLVTDVEGQPVKAKGEPGKDGDANLQIVDTYDSITIVYNGETFIIPKDITPEPFPTSHTFYRMAEYNVSATPKEFAKSHKNNQSGYYTWEQALTACPEGYRLPVKAELFDFAPRFFSFADNSDVFYAIIGKGVNKAAFRYQKIGKYGWLGEPDLDAHFKVTGRYLGENFSMVSINTISDEAWWEKHNEKDIIKIFPGAGIKYSNGNMDSNKQASFWTSERRGDEEFAWHWNTGDFGASIGVYSIDYYFSVRCIRKQ